MQKQCFNKKETAELLGISVATIEKMMRDGILPYAKLSRRVLITIDDIGKAIGQDRAKSLLIEKKI